MLESIVGEEIDAEATEPPPDHTAYSFSGTDAPRCLRRSTIYRWMAEGKFPKPVQFGGYSVAWAENEVETRIAYCLI